MSNEYGNFCIMSTLDSGPDNVRSLAKAPSGRSDLQSIYVPFAVDLGYRLNSANHDQLWGFRMYDEYLKLRVVFWASW